MAKFFGRVNLRIEEVEELSTHPLTHSVLILFENFLVRLGKLFVSVVVLATVHHILREMVLLILFKR